MVSSRPGRRTTIVTDAREPGQVERGLAGGVAAADHDDVVALHLAGRGHRGAVVDADADQLLERGYAELAVGDAAGDQRRPGPGRRRRRCAARAARRRVPGSSAVTSQPVKNLVPKRIAWLRARCASRMPEMPRGKPR